MQPHFIKLAGLTVCHPYAALFKDQVEYLKHLHKELLNERMMATETQHSFAKVVLLFAYFLAYLQQQFPASQFSRLVYLAKSVVQVEEANKAIGVVREVRRLAGLPTSASVEQFQLQPSSMETSGPTIVLATIRQYIKAAMYRSLYAPGCRSILYISECDTLDLECEEVFAKDVSWLGIYYAMEERQYLQAKYVPAEEDFDAELRALNESLKDPNFKPDHVALLADDRKLLGLIRYVLNFFKHRQKQLEQARKKVLVNRKISEFVQNELEGELMLSNEANLSRELLLNLKRYFLRFLRKHGVEERAASKILEVCEFLQAVIIVQRQFEAENKNAFRMFANCRSQHQNYIYRLVCIDPKIMFSRVYPQPMKHFNSSKYHSEPQQQPPGVLLVLNSYSCLQREFFYSHFKLQVSISTFVSKEVAAQNILSMSVVCNAFEVDLKSDDYDSDNRLQVQRSYGTLIEELAEAIPDGIVVFISSYRYLLTLIGEWTRERILDKVRTSKMVFFEVENDKQNRQNLELFRKSCDFGRGAIFFISVRSKAFENCEFRQHYSNLVVFLGYPMISEVEAHTKEKLEYLNERQKAKEYDYLEQDAMRHVNKWMVGLLGDSRTERKMMLFADARFSMTMVPAWMEVADGNLSISTAIEKCKEFYRRDRVESLPSLIRASLYVG